MSLTTRLSAFFLVTLALALGGFSTILFFLARAYLYQQIDDRLHASVATLHAAADFSDEGVEWEAKDRHLSLGQGDEEDQVRWLVQDERSVVIDRSPNLGSASFWETDQTLDQPLSADAFFLLKQGQAWRVLQSRLDSKTRLSQHGPNHQSGDGNNRAGARGLHSVSLTITAGFSLAPVEATLRTLALLSGGISLGLWVVAALLGHWLCRQALVPVTRMAQAAQCIDASALDQRLPEPGTHDELQELARAFNAMLTRLQEAFARQTRFTGDASHQLRTPLTALLGQIEVTLRRDRPTEEYQRTLVDVQKQALHLRQIVEMLLFLARADAETKLAHLEEIDLADWLPRHLQAWSEHQRYGDLKLEIAPEGAFRARVQLPLLGQLVNNLVENASKYSQPGTPIVMVLGVGPRDVTLTIQDSGCGIDAVDLPHLFEPFYRSLQARRSGLKGVGLGLSVAQRIANVFDGKITVVSEAGQGARFTLHLPRTNV